MKVLIIGLGSMGKRRMRLLKNNFNNLTIAGVDDNSERRRQAQDLYDISTYLSLKQALQDTDFDCAFVCTSPLTHQAIIHECLERSVNVFSEINLVSDGYDKLTKLAEDNHVKLFQSATALYKEEMKYIINTTENLEKPVCYNYHVGQYLPDWHPWEKYTDFFVSDNRTNGCREILALELTWIVKAFGKISDINVISSRLTSLNIDYNDVYLVQLVHENGSKGSLIVDVVCREAVRSLRIFNETIFIEWDGRPDSLKSKNLQTGILEPVFLYGNIDKLEGYNSMIIENHYLDEIIAFFEYINYDKNPGYMLSDDKYILDIIDQIESQLNSSGKTFL